MLNFTWVIFSLSSSSEVWILLISCSMGETYFSFAGFEDTLDGGIKPLGAFSKFYINIWDEQICSIINNRFNCNQIYSM